MRCAVVCNQNTSPYVFAVKRLTAARMRGDGTGDEAKVRSDKVFV